VSLRGIVKLPGGPAALTDLNDANPGYPPMLASGGIGLFSSAWGSFPRVGAVRGLGSVTEVLVRAGRVARITHSAGAGSIPVGSFVLLGAGAGGRLLARLGLVSTAATCPGYSSLTRTLRLARSIRSTYASITPPGPVRRTRTSPVPGPIITPCAGPAFADGANIITTGAPSSTRSRPRATVRRLAAGESASPGAADPEAGQYEADRPSSAGSEQGHASPGRSSTSLRGTRVLR
jgi:hypothetical protein